jgi:hypothetical protein
MEKIMNDILTPISPGELLDKITILHIKAENIQDLEKLVNVQIERAALQRVIDAHIPDNVEISELVTKLQMVNKELWDIEDAIRDCERDNSFEAEFIRLARAVYITNDKRAELKKQINIALGSKLIEEKSYTKY